MCECVCLCTHTHTCIHVHDFDNLNGETKKLITLSDGKKMKFII